MAKKRKIAKRKTAKKKSAKTAKTRVAKKKSAKRATTKRSKAKVAKRKTAKRKTTKRKVPPRRTREDPCKAKRDERNRLSQAVRDIRLQMGDRDVPDHVIQDLQRLLAQTQTQLNTAQRELAACEAEHRPPRM